MKKITVVSGKGGTGKTSLVASFAALASRKALLVDGDVDAANLSLLLKPVLIEKYQFKASCLAVIDQARCDECDICRTLCRFEAISKNHRVDPLACEGCGLCFHACPQQAVKMEEKISGEWFVSDTPYGILVHAQLGIAEENSGKLVTAVRTRGQQLAEAAGYDYIVIDGPPGIGCPVIASLAGTDAALIVTEPTVSGIHDLERVVTLCRHFGIPAAICINRCDLAPTQTRDIEKYCRKEGLALVGKIPHDRTFVSAMLAGMPVVEYPGGHVAGLIRSTWLALLAGFEVN